MKKQTKISGKGIWTLSLMMIFLGMTVAELGAQDIIHSGTKDMVVTSDHENMYIVLQGGDGGKNSIGNGGRGATVTGWLNIGTGSGMIPPGSTLRFIAGAAGESTEIRGSGGGGASGLVFKAPGTSTWTTIAVAAGGGGATIDLGGWNSSGEDGGPGKTSINNMEKTPSYLPWGLQGGGTHTSSDDPCGGQAGMYNGSPEQVAVGSGCSAKGGAGFGSGASTHDSDGNGKKYYGGGGGGHYGGYIGISGGNPVYDNGGGSWANITYIAGAKAYSNGTTGSPQNGFAMYTYEEEIRFAYNTNKCLDDYKSGTDNGTNIQTYSCTDNINQMWLIHPTDRTIHSKLNYNKCLDLSNSNTSNGSNIQLYDCNGTEAQNWVYNGLYKTIHSSENFDKCLDAANGTATSSNVNVQLWDCQYSNYNQKWLIEGASTVSNPANVRFIIPVYAPDFAVHSHTGAESGSNIQLWTKDDANTAEQWYFDGLAIKMRNNQNLCVDLSQSNTSNGNNIQLYNCNGSNAQKWIYDGMTKSIRSVVNPDKCMQIEKNTDGVYGKRSNVNIYDCNSSAAQQFLIQE
ncbi:MAG: ricin-type beta-trefoil lectin domain protein [Saprospiraceae bacterium]